MASTDATSQPVKGQAYRLTEAFTLVTTGKASSGTLTALASVISKDQGAYASTTNSATQQGTTEIVYVDLTATEMNADTVIVKFTSTLANTIDVIRKLNPVDLSEVAGRPDAGVKKPERFILSLYRRFFNQRTTTRSSGTMVQYLADSTTTDVSTSINEGNDTVTVGKSS